MIAGKHTLLNSPHFANERAALAPPIVPPRMGIIVPAGQLANGGSQTKTQLKNTPLAQKPTNFIARSARLKRTPANMIDLQSAWTMARGLQALERRTDAQLQAEITALSGMSGSSPIKFWMKGVPLKFHARQHRTVGSTVKHPDHIYRLDAASCLLVLAGCWDAPDLFQRLLEANQQQQVNNISKTLQYANFIAPDSLRHAVRRAAYYGVLAEQVGSPVDPFQFYFPTSLAIATFLIGSNRHPRSQYEQAVNQIFDIIFDCGGIDLIHFDPVANPPAALPPLTRIQRRCQSQYWGAVVGMCLGGLCTFGEIQNERSEQHKNNLKFAISLLGTALSVAPLIGGVIGAGVSALADPISDAAYHKSNMEGVIAGVGAQLESGMRREPGNLLPQKFSEQLELTVRHTQHSY